MNAKMTEMFKQQKAETDALKARFAKLAEAAKHLRIRIESSRGVVLVAAPDVERF